MVVKLSGSFYVTVQARNLDVSVTIGIGDDCDESDFVVEAGDNKTFIVDENSYFTASVAK